jgi:uncharacterized protein (TIGR03437 family)
MLGQNLCSQTAMGQWIGPDQLPTSLGGCSLTVNGSPAMLVYVAPEVINFVVPKNMTPGSATVTVMNGVQRTTASMTIAASGPGVFAMNSMGMGEGAVLHSKTWQPGPFSVTSGGKPTPVSIFMTGLDLSSQPEVSIGGMPADVTFFGNTPGYAGLQVVNVRLSANMAGAGMAPVTVTSGGRTSNVTLMEILPTTVMMQGMPGWGSGMMVGENAARGRELSYVAFNAANHTALVTDENDDAVWVISLDSKTIVATITLPGGSEARGIAVNDAGTLAAVALSNQASVALIDLAQNQPVAVIGTGYYPSHVAFSGTKLLVTNGRSGTVSVIDSSARVVLATVNVGFGPSGIAANGNLAVVANMQAASLSLVRLTDYSVTTIPLPPGSRPHEVALSAAANKAVITLPMSGGVLLLDLGTQQITPVDLGVLNAIGPGAVAASGSLAYIASQMTASVTVLDLNGGRILSRFSVDPGPRSLALDSTGNRLLVMAQGTGTLDIVDLGSYQITARVNAVETERHGNWTLPLIQSVTPTSAAAGSSFTLTITGANLSAVTNIEFRLASMQNTGASGGMMGGGGMGQGMGGEDDDIKVTNVQVNAAGTEITASVQILSSASAGTLQIRLETDHGDLMGPMAYSLFTVTK